MQLEDDLLADHMIGKGVILFEGEVLRELTALTEAKIWEHKSCSNFLASYRSH